MKKEKNKKWDKEKVKRIVKRVLLAIGCSIVILLLLLTVFSQIIN